MGVSHILKDKRTELNYTLLDIAKKVGVSEATVQRWESGNIKNLRYEKIIALADVLEISPSCLMGWDNEFENRELHKIPSKLKALIGQLNDKGQEKVIDYASDLVTSGNYKPQEAPKEESDEVSKEEIDSVVENVLNERAQPSG